MNKHRFSSSGNIRLGCLATALNAGLALIVSGCMSRLSDKGFEEQLNSNSVAVVENVGTAENRGDESIPYDPMSEAFGDIPKDNVRAGFERAFELNKPQRAYVFQKENGLEVEIRNEEGNTFVYKGFELDKRRSTDTERVYVLSPENHFPDHAFTPVSDEFLDHSPEGTTAEDGFNLAVPYAGYHEIKVRTSVSGGKETPEKVEVVNRRGDVIILGYNSKTDSFAR